MTEPTNPQDPKQPSDSSEPVTEPAPAPAESQPAESEVERIVDEELDAALEDRLSRPVLEGMAGMDLAQSAVAAFLVVVVGFLLYSSGLATPFHYHEQERLFGDGALQGVATAADAWDAYALRPLAALSLALDGQLGGGSPRLFRFTSLFLHLANAALVFALARQILGVGVSAALAMVAGLAFATAPIAADIVSDLTLRDGLLATLFVLLSLVLYARAARAPQIRPGLYVAALACYMAAWASHAAAWIVPLLIIAVDGAVEPHRKPADRALRAAPFFALLVALLVVHVAGGAAGNRFGDAAGFAAQGRLLPHYLALLFAPNGPIDFTATESVIWPWILAVAIVLALALSIRWPRPAFGLLFFLLVIAAPGFLYVADAADDSLAYLAFAGIAILPAWIIAATSGSMRAPLGVFVAGLIGVSGYLAFMRADVWQDEQILWQQAAATCPTCPEPLAYLGRDAIARAESVLIAAGATPPAPDQAAAVRSDAFTAYAEAETYLTRAAELTEPTSPRAANVLQQLGAAQSALGKQQEAAATLAESIAADPTQQFAALRLAALAEARGDRRDALDWYAYAAQREPLPPEAAYRYASLLLSIGDAARAQEFLSTLPAAASDTLLGQARARVQQTLAGQQDLLQRANQYAQADPNDPRVHELQARALLVQGMPLQAAYVLDEIQRTTGTLTPDQWELLGMARARLQGFDNFLAAWEQPPDGAPEDAWQTMAERLLDSGLVQAAAGAYGRVQGIADRQQQFAALAEYAAANRGPAQVAAVWRAAAEHYPQWPQPWLALADIAANQNDVASAQRLIEEAEARGANAEDISSRRAKIGAN